MDKFKLHMQNIRIAARKIIEQKTNGQAVLTDDQYELIDKLARWMDGMYKQNSGVLIIGNIGVGKTTIMQALVAYYKHYHNKAIPEVHAKQLPVEYHEKGLSYFYKRPLFIDDLGKEPKNTVIWGQKFDTWADIFCMRYDNRALTFATANYDMKSFEEIYGNVVIDRMIEHFNVFVLYGNSFRK